MSIKGNMETREALVGDIHLLKKIPGYSAYEIAVKHGFKGTEAEWLISISAYGIAVKLGFEGTVEEWIASLKGEKGDIGNVEFHGGIDALGERIKNVADPVEDGDAVNKKHFDGVLAESLEESAEAAKAYADETFVALGYEDITNNFILTPEGGLTLPAINKISVLKKDREIRGFIEFDLTDFTNGIMCYINRDYLPVHTVVADAVVIGNEDVPVGEYFPVVLKYIVPNQFVCWKPVPEGTTKMFINFSYICKENEVTV